MLPKQGMGALSDDTRRAEQVFPHEQTRAAVLLKKSPPFESKGGLWLSNRLPDQCRDYLWLLGG
ncbi:Uncharacterised protein [Aeromonas salmonicida]|nr:Uncharacterised protein [Aeromonas salmonicida]